LCKDSNKGKNRLIQAKLQVSKAAGVGPIANQNHGQAKITEGSRPGGRERAPGVAQGSFKP